MFHTDQIITSTELVKHFRQISIFLEHQQSPILVSQKGSQFLVLMTAEMFEDLVAKKLKNDGVERMGSGVRSIFLRP